MRVARAPLILTALVTLAALALILPGAARAEDQRQLAVILLPDTGASNYTELRILSPTGGLVRTIVGRPSNNLGSPSWSPDEKTLAYSENGNVLLQPIAGGAEKTLVPGNRPAWSPVADQLAYWSFTSPTTSLHLIDADGSHDHVIAGPFQSSSVDSVSPSWSPDGKKLAFGLNGAIDTVPAVGGASPTPIASPGPGELLQRPAFAPDGTHIAFVRYPNLPLSPDGRRRDLLVVRDLTNGTEQTVVDHTSGRVYMGNVASPSWSADSQRIAYIEDDFGFSPTRYRVVTVSRDGSARQVLLENDKFINFISWDNVPTRPNYYVRDVEVAQAISPDLEPLLPFDSQPQLSDPYTREWQQPKAFGTPIPLIADKSTLLRIYVGDAKLPSGSTARRSIHFRVVDEATSIPYDGTQDADVSAPGVAPVQTQAVSAINVWLPADAAKPGPPHNFAVEINADETAPECAGCYPNGNRATVTGVAFEEGGNVVLAPVPIIEFNPDRTVVRPDAHELQKAVDDAVGMLPVADDGVKIDSSSPGALLVPRQEITADDGCHRLLTELLTLRASAGIEGPVAGFGATRWVGYAPPILQPPNASPCEGKAEQPGRNLVLLGPNADTFAHELGHTLGLTHIRGRSGGGLRFRLFASSYPYSPGIGGVGYKLEPLAGASFTGILPSSTTADIMSYDDQTWTSPRTWLMMHERILAESGSSRPRADSARAAATARAPAVRRLVSGVVNGNKSVIYGSVVTVASNVAQAGPQAARVLAIDRRGKTVAQATIRGTAYLDKGQSQPTLPFVVALPNKTSITSIELLPARGHRPLARLKRTRHAPAGRLLQLPKRVPGTRLLTVRWRSADRDRGDKLTVMLLARRGRGAFRAIVLGPATGSFGLVPRTLGRRGKLSLRLQVSDGFTTTVLGARPITVR